MISNRVQVLIVFIVILISSGIGYIYGQSSANAGVEIKTIYVKDSVSVKKLDSLKLYFASFKDSVALKKTVKYVNRDVIKYDTSGRMVSRELVHDTILITDSVSLAIDTKIDMSKVTKVDSTSTKEISVTVKKYKDTYNEFDLGLETNKDLNHKVYADYSRALPLGLNVGLGADYSIVTKQVDYLGKFFWKVRF